jgi:hypothetical protein
MFPDWVAEHWQRMLPSFVNDLSPVYNIAPVSIARYVPPAISPSLQGVAVGVSVVVLLTSFVLAVRARAGQQQLQLPVLLIAAAAVGAPVVESYHLVWLLLPIWVLVSSLRTNADAGTLAALAASLLLLSQPYHIGGLLASLAPLPREAFGGMCLELGAVLLFFTLCRSYLVERTHQRAISP